MALKGVDFAAVPATAIRVVTSPAAFFRALPKTGGYVEPLVFMVAMGLVGGAIQVVVNILGMHGLAAAGAGVASIVVMPVVVAIFGFVGAAVMYAIWRAMGSPESYETAYRCGAYLSALTPVSVVLGVVPYLGAIVGLALTAYFLVIASVEVHKLPARKAWLVFGIIGAVLAVMNLSAQFAARRVASRMEESGAQMKEQAEALRKSAEELQRQVERAQKSRN